jgi:hypothetical protein
MSTLMEVSFTLGLHDVIRYVQGLCKVYLYIPPMCVHPDILLPHLLTM